ncbi:C40 family peptidase [Robertkochia sediminum]|uniref:C40 family peptidase n=1 Tax=Robertkochia sediminum TaxID=2785326 RepID=UPI0019315C1E|nr:SH3 domain-containing C40 family peptidase [Robertkochia sediminum]MBL7473762.1 C40 family peptidase [Robertkochia sediminum]
MIRLNRSKRTLIFGSHTFSVPSYLRTSVPSLVLVLSLTIFFTSCQPESASNAEVDQLLENMQKTYAPDKRVARFHLDLEKQGAQWVLKGQSDQKEAYAALKDSLSGLRLKYIDSVQQLPESGLGADTLAVVRLSVANLRSNKGQSEELASQATMGTVVKVLAAAEGNWHLVQTPDGYIAWADDGAITLMNAEELKGWQEKQKLVFSMPYGHARTEPSEKAGIVSDLVAGDIFAYIGEEGDFLKIEYPDGRQGYVSKDDAFPYDLWIELLETDGESLVAMAKEMMGLPYLWGGTSFKGVDCSGFTKTVYFLNGLILPRDASQQVHSGMLVDEEGDFSKLQPGDLLFFGRYREDGSEKVTHVGMWIGNNEFIHSSGDVHISSMDPEASNYDEFNRNRYFRAKRILGNLTEDVKKVEDVY